MLVDDKTLLAAVDTSSSSSDTIPDELLCPITLTRLREPVVAADGLTYERQALASWIDKHAAGAAVLSPATGAPLAHRTLIPDEAILRTMGKGRPAARVLAP